MSATTWAPSELRPRRLRRVEYDKLVEAGCFQGEHVELIHGMIVEMSPRGPDHDDALEVLADILAAQLPGEVRVRCQMAFVASDDSEPEPDLAVVKRDRVRGRHPSHAYLVVEVAWSSLSTDRTLKAEVYATSGVPEYWIVNVASQQVEVLRLPAQGHYTRAETYGRSDMLTIAAFPGVSVRVGDLFGP